MPYHVLAYYGATHATNNFDMFPASDAIFSIQNNHYLPHIDCNLYGGWFGSADLQAVRLVTPRSRQVVPPPLYPIQEALLPPDRPHIFDRRSNPFKLNAVEEVSIQVNVAGAADENIHAILFVGTSLDQVPAGDIYCLHGTSTTVAQLSQWQQIAVTWDQTIPAGTYAMISSQHVSNSAIAHRWVFKAQILRPGFLSMGSLGNITEPSWYYGGWGMLGQFNTYTYPVMEVYCNGADANHDVTMNIIKIG